MAVTTTTALIQYDGDDSTVSFPTVFKFLANADIQITHRDSSGTETVWVENTQYTLTGARVSSGGTVTVDTSPTDYTPASGETITIERITAETQGTEYPEGGAFPASAHETALDRLTMLVQQASAKIGRALRFPVTDSSSLSGEIPNSDDRASSRLGFDSSGEPIAVTADITGVAATAFGTSLVEAANAAAGRTVMDAEQADADILKADTADVLTAGFAATIHAAGTKSSGTYTPDESDGNLQSATNGGAHTLAPPANDTTIIIQYTNNASAGAITTSGFTAVDGDTISTDDGDDFLFYITNFGSFSHLNVKALQ